MLDNISNFDPHGEVHSTSHNQGMTKDQGDLFTSTD